MWYIVFIAVGGSLGALSRYFISWSINQVTNDIFPWGTFIINVSGSFLIGIFYELFDRVILPSDLKALISIGFLGAFTTFSTYSLESINLFKLGQYKSFIINILFSNFFGLTAVILGMFLIRIILKAVR